MCLPAEADSQPWRCDVACPCCRHSLAWTGITEDVASWCTNVVSRLVDAVGLEHLQFEAADPPVFSWWVRGTQGHSATALPGWQIRSSAPGRPSLHLQVHQNFWRWGQSVCGPLADRAAGVPQARHLGNQEHVGAPVDLWQWRRQWRQQWRCQHPSAGSMMRCAWG